MMVKILPNGEKFDCVECIGETLLMTEFCFPSINEK